MTKHVGKLFGALALGMTMCAGLSAGTLAPGDSLSIVFDPTDGALHGQPNDTVGWGFTVNWTSTSGHWITFTGSALGSVDPGQNESNPGVLQSYTDFIGLLGGPDPASFALSPSFGPWVVNFDLLNQTGIGAYQITGDTSFVGANDHGEMTIFYDVYDTDPSKGGVDFGATGLGTGSYYGASTAFSVTVDAPTTELPEPGSLVMMATGALALGALARRRLSRGW